MRILLNMACSTIIRKIKQDIYATSMYMLHTKRVLTNILETSGLYQNVSKDFDPFISPIIRPPHQLRSNGVKKRVIQSFYHIRGKVGFSNRNFFIAVKNFGTAVQ